MLVFSESTLLCLANKCLTTIDLSMSTFLKSVIKLERGSGVQNTKSREPYLFIGVLGASLVYSMSKPCGSLVGF